MFERVSAGHAGKYTCSAAGEDNEVKFEYVEVKVMQKEVGMYVCLYVCMYVLLSWRMYVCMCVCVLELRRGFWW